MKRPWRFKYDLRAIPCAGVTWYCQRPGRVWATDPRRFPDWRFRLVYQEHLLEVSMLPTGWYLYGPACRLKGDFVGSTLAEAMMGASIYLPQDMRDPM